MCWQFFWRMVLGCPRLGNCRLAAQHLTSRDVWRHYVSISVVYEGELVLQLWKWYYIYIYMWPCLNLFRLAVRCRNVFRTALVVRVSPNARTKTAGCLENSPDVHFWPQKWGFDVLQALQKKALEYLFSIEHTCLGEIWHENVFPRFSRLWRCMFDWSFAQDGCRCLLSFAEFPSEAINLFKVFVCQVHGKATVHMKIPLNKNNPPYRSFLPNLSPQR